MSDVDINCSINNTNDNYDNISPESGSNENSLKDTDYEDDYQNELYFTSLANEVDDQVLLAKGMNRPMSPSMKEFAYDLKLYKQNSRIYAIDEISEKSGRSELIVLNEKLKNLEIERILAMQRSFSQLKAVPCKSRIHIDFDDKDNITSVNATFEEASNNKCDLTNSNLNRSSLTLTLSSSAKSTCTNSYVFNNDTKDKGVIKKKSRWSSNCNNCGCFGRQKRSSKKTK